MATILVMDDEPISSARLLAALYGNGHHQAWIAETLNGGMQLAEELGSDVDLLILDVSMFDLAAPGFLEFFTRVSPLASILLLSPSKEQGPHAEYRVLRKPFSDREFLAAVDEVIAMSPLQRAEAMSRPGRPPNERYSEQAPRMAAHTHHNRRARFLPSNRRSRRQRHDGSPQTGIG